MSTQVPTVAANISVENLIDNYIMKTDNRAFIVYDGDRSVGLVTIDDVSNVAPNARALTIVEDIMTPSEKLEVISPNEEASDAFYSLQEKNIRQLPVVTGNNAIVGLLRRKDIIRWLQFQSQTR
jgi:CBS domain-containing protein